LLTTLKRIAEEHGVSIANVAVRYILDRPAVAGVIVGARLGASDRRSDNVSVFNLTLGDDDRNGVEAVLAKSQDLYKLIGDCGDEYRR
jgi:aryl-alcohol dehydrogenase-like predicted oxidoreductase